MQFSVLPGEKFSETQDFSPDWEYPPQNLTIIEPDELKYWSNELEGLRHNWIKDIPYLGYLCYKIGLVK